VDWGCLGNCVKITSTAMSISIYFDLPGLISPSVIPYKKFLQVLWLHKISWDNILPTDCWKNGSNSTSNMTVLESLKSIIWYR